MDKYSNLDWMVRSMLFPGLNLKKSCHAMGSTAIGIIYSPWGKQSGAHINPSTTLTFFRLGKVTTWDAVFYIIAQFVGAVAGALLASAVLAA